MDAQARADLLDKLLKAHRQRWTLTDLMPYMQIVSIIAFSILASQWHNKTWRHRAYDLIACVPCLILARLQKPLLSLAYAIFYTTWTILPGELASIPDLPSHTTFMRSLVLVKAEDESEEECKICWDDHKELAQLPCKHKYCRPCLQRMGDALQTACPLCRRPLFSSYDRLVYLANKGSVVFAAINATLLVFIAIVEILRAEYFNVCMTFIMIFVNIGYLWLIRTLIVAHGDNWWRGAPSSAGQLALSCFSCAGGLFNFVQMVRGADRLF